MAILILFSLVLITVITCVAVIVSVIHRKSRQAVKFLTFYLVGLGLYLGAVVAVAVSAPQRVLNVDEDHCFDDWCIAVTKVTQTRELGPADHILKANRQFYVIQLRLSNHARGRDQRASSVAIHLLDGQGRWYDISQQGQNAWEMQFGKSAPLTATIPFGQSLVAVQVFDLPTDARDLGLYVEHPVGFSPDLLIIGDEASLFHRPTIVRIP